MDILLDMARLASLRCAAVDIVEMAICTGYRGMRTGERKYRQGMVEGGVFPAFDCMAGRAILPELALMWVVFCMASEARCGCFQQRGKLMATLATDLNVFAQQGEIRRIVVERNFLPLLRRVA